MLSKRFALLSENYFLIPLEYLVYYPSLPISFTKHVQCCFFVGIMHKLLRFWFAYVVYSCAMLPNLYAMAHAQAQDWTRIFLKYFKAFVTIIVWGMDIDIKPLVKMTKFSDIHFIGGLCSVKRIGY